MRSTQCTRESSSDTSSGPDTKKRKVSHSTYLKWKTDLDRDCQTMSWLNSTTETSSGKKMVTQLKCNSCTKYSSSVTNRRNYSDKGADSVRTSNIRDHSNISDLL